MNNLWHHGECQRCFASTAIQIRRNALFTSPEYAYLKEIQRDRADMPAADGDFAYRRALQAENVALAEYKRILRVFADLVVEGKTPDESASA